jgi:hypothetical protein
VDNPDSVEVDEQVEERSLFEVSLEEDLVPFDAVKLHESLSRRDVDESGLVRQDDSRDTLGIPEQLVDVVVTDDPVMVELSSQKFAVDDFVSLISQELVQGLDDRSEIETLGNRVDSVLTFGRSVVVVGALEDEAETFRHESDLSGLAPTQQVQGDLSEAIVL